MASSPVGESEDGSLGIDYELTIVVGNCPSSDVDSSVDDGSSWVCLRRYVYDNLLECKGGLLQEMLNSFKSF